MNMQSNMDIHGERSLTITRVLKAPRDLVWETWTQINHLKEWWGPEQFATPVMEGEVRKGGELRIVMRGPKGSPWDKDLPMVMRFREVVPGKKLVFENEPLGPSGEKLIEGLTTVTFDDHPDGTLVVMTTDAKALTEPALTMIEGMNQGWAQTFDKLARYVTKNL
jgi:uncharacterized protein YndB with AHSA1/START domain